MRQLFRYEFADINSLQCYYDGPVALYNYRARLNWFYDSFVSLHEESLIDMRPLTTHVETYMICRRIRLAYSTVRKSSGCAST